MSKFNFTNSSAAKCFNEHSGRFVDTDIDFLQKDMNQLKNQLATSSIIHDLNAIGIKPDTENAELIAINMPANSILVYHKMGNKIDFYPERTGLLIVEKGLDESRVSFSFSIFDRKWFSFYDSLRGTPELWSGWKEVYFKSSLEHSELDEIINQKVKDEVQRCLNSK